MFPFRKRIRPAQARTGVKDNYCEWEDEEILAGSLHKRLVASVNHRLCS